MAPVPPPAEFAGPRGTIPGTWIRTGEPARPSLRLGEPSAHRRSAGVRDEGVRDGGAWDGERSAEAIRRLRDQAVRAAEPKPSMARRAAAPLFAAMRAKDWVTGLAIPLVGAVVVVVSVVVVAGANVGAGSLAPPALSAGFPPARVATADFTGTRVAVSALASSDATEVAAGSADGFPALWTSTDGGSTWARAAGATPEVLDRAGRNQLTGVTHGQAGWLAVGGTPAPIGRPAAAGAAAATRSPVVVGSAGGKTWMAADGEATFAGPGLITSAAAAGPAGYVIVGRQVSGGRTFAAAWYASGLTGWRRAIGARAGTLDGSGTGQMSAVTATARGFAAVGSAGTSPAAWLSPNGRSWWATALPLPPGTARAALRYVSAIGNTVAAAGTAMSAAGQRRPFAAVSANGGGSWSLTLLPVPEDGARYAADVTALTSAGGGFTATGTYGRPGARHVVVWQLPGGAGPAAAWRSATPDGTGLAGPGTQAITALTGSGAALTGIGFVATAAREEPTLWQAPVR